MVKLPIQKIHPQKLANTLYLESVWIKLILLKIEN